MCEGRLKAIWDPASAVIAMIANVNRDPDKCPEPYSPKDFNPYRQDEVNEEVQQTTGFWQRIGNVRVFPKEAQQEIVKSLFKGAREHGQRD